MRFVTWNCHVGGFKRKAARMAALRPDVLVVPEVEQNLEEQLLFDGDVQPTYRKRFAAPGWQRGLGIFSYTGSALAPMVDESSALQGFIPFRLTLGAGAIINVVGVWTYQTKDKATHYRQAHAGLEKYREMLAAAPTVILGDFNANATYSPRTHWVELVAMTEALGLVSAYHHYFKEQPGKESRPTYFHHAKADNPFHVDYCFIPKVWTERPWRVEVGTHAEWSGDSDHMPLIVDVEP